GLGEALGLLSPPAEHERVAALQPHHAPPGARVLDHQALDVRLLDLGLAGALADVRQLGILARAAQRLGGNQPVVQDHVGARDELCAAHGHEPGIARSGADQVHDAGARGGRHAASSARSRISRAPAASIRSANDSPRATGCSGSPATRSRTHSEPSGSPAYPRSTSSAPSRRAQIPTGVWQVAPIPLTAARSAVSPTRVSWSEIPAAAAATSA